MKRCSLTALGTLRSRRESFNDSIKSDLESPLSPKEGTDAKDLEKEDVVTSKTKSSTKAIETSAIKRDKSNLSVVESDWDSDESLPLDKSTADRSVDKGNPSPKQRHQISVDVHHEPAGDDDLPAPPSPSQLAVPEEIGYLQVGGLAFAQTLDSIYDRSDVITHFITLLSSNRYQIQVLVLLVLNQSVRNVHECS